MKTYYVYLLASRRNGTLYCGVTNNLIRRVYEHRNHKIPGFTARYGVTLLVWYEQHGDIHEAILRETRIKGWRRAWKLELIENANPQWRDLYESLLPGPAIDRTRAKGETIPINPPDK
jgi:putative endonuclease